MPFIIFLSLYIFWPTYSPSNIEKKNLSTVSKILIDDNIKNKSNEYKIIKYSKLNDTTLIPYLDKLDIKIDKQVDISIKNKESGNWLPLIETFYFNSTTDAKKVHNLLNKKEKISLTKNRINFINLEGKDAEKISSKILLEIK